MLSLQPRHGYGLLRCPLCGLELAAGALVGRTLVCRNRDSFDLAREGYVNLLRSRGGHSAAAGDNAMQLRHRAAFLAAGHFDAISAAIAEHVWGVDANPALAPWRILDAGFGTGHHLAKLAAALPAPVVGLGLDIARDAARQAARRWPHHAFAVADLWGEWPVRDAAVDLVVSIFAPKRPSGDVRHHPVIRPQPQGLVMPSDNLTIRIVPFDPHAASDELWTTFYQTRRAILAELWPSEPMLSEAEFRTEVQLADPLWEIRRWVALEGREVVGYVRVGFRRSGTPNADDHAPFLGGWGAIRADARRRGAGSLLLREVQRLMHELDKRVLTLSADAQPGHAFLKHIGAVEKHWTVERRSRGVCGA